MHANTYYVLVTLHQNPGSIKTPNYKANIGYARVNALIQSVRQGEPTFLLVEHINKQSHTSWKTVGGGIEQNESPEEALEREISEEMKDDHNRKRILEQKPRFVFSTISILNPNKSLAPQRGSQREYEYIFNIFFHYFIREDFSFVPSPSEVRLKRGVWFLGDSIPNKTKPYCLKNILFDYRYELLREDELWKHFSAVLIPKAMNKFIEQNHLEIELGRYSDWFYPQGLELHRGHQKDLLYLK